jgi:DNA polymerase-3 subunit beta
MNISFEPKHFAHALYKLLGVTNTKGPLTIIANALLTANEDNTVVLEATDLEISVSTRLTCDVQTPGQLCVNAHNLHSVIKGLVGEEARLEAQDNHWARLESGDVDCRIVGVPPVEFPKLPDFGEVATFSMETNTLLDIIDRTIFSVSSDEGRPNLMGAFFCIRSGEIMAVSTDGHRLSKVLRQVETPDDLPQELIDGVIIPKKSLTELRRTVDASIEHLELGVSGTNAIFRFGETTIMVRLVDATFPDYKRVIPDEEKEKQARVNTDEFLQKLKFVALFANQRTSNVSLLFDGDTLQLEASDPDTGESKETMSIGYGGSKVQVGFNYRYLLNVLGVLRESEFRFQVTDAYSAVTIHDGDRTDDLFLVMPMRP